MTLNELPKLCVLYFHADWCSPCKQVKPAVQRMKDEGVNVVEIDIEKDENAELVSFLQIYSIPAFSVIEDRKEILNQRGVIDLKKTKEIIELYKNSDLYQVEE